MAAYYNKDARDCDELTEAEFAGNLQNVERIERLRSNILLSGLAKLLGGK